VSRAQRVVSLFTLTAVTRTAISTPSIFCSPEISSAINDQFVDYTQDAVNARTIDDLVLADEQESCVGWECELRFRLDTQTKPLGLLVVAVMNGERM
jgi:hypothetical protein